jgi:hypothetical protein
MLSIRSLVEGLGVFERSRVLFGLKVLGLAFIFIKLEGASRTLSEMLKSLRLLFGSGLGSLMRRLTLSHLECLGGL